MKLAIDFDSLIGVSAPNFQGSDNVVTNFVETLIPYFFTFAGIGLLIYLIIGGLQLMTSRGNPKMVEMAKGKITNALLGFVIVFTAYWITQIIGLLFGIDAITEVFPL